MLRKIVSLSGARRAQSRRERLDRLITASGLFDPEWYLCAYPDVAGFPDGPLAHFMLYGAAEGRAAGPRFDTKAYLAANPDVALLGGNPLVHYLEHGLREGRTLAESGGGWHPSPRPHGGRRLDIFDEAMIAAAAGPGLDPTLGTFEPSRLQPALRSGIRIVLELLRHRDLRVRFPRALHEGPDGPFARFATTEGLARLEVSPEHAPWIEAALAAEPGMRAHHRLVSDADLRRREPLFLMPTGAWMACRTLFAALRDGSVTHEEIWWFLIRSAQDAQAALCETWALTPAWQAAVPDGGTVFGILRLAEWVAETHDCHDPAIFAQRFPTLLGEADQVRLAYGARPDWQRRCPEAMTDEAAARALLAFLQSPGAGLHALPLAWLAERSCEALAREIVRPGLTVIGHFAYPSGLRISVENLVQGLDRQGVALSLRNAPTTRDTDEPLPGRFQGMETHDTTLIHLQPEPYFLRAYPQAGLRPRPERTYRIGYWYWEFDAVPEAWNEAALHCDEFWTATEFVAAGLRRQYRQPVHVLPPGVEIAPFTPLSRAAFGLRDDEFVFVFVFHMTSVMDRKNPFGLIEAFTRAFPAGEPARLVIKTSFGERHPDELARLKAAAAGANVTVIDRTTAHEETLSLMAAADAYVSLHRSEGLGLTMAEAMLLGRPVIATRYSGNLDFMDDGNSLLVDCELVTLDRDIPPYEAGMRWAEPDIAHAARLMRRLFDDPDAARALGLRAKADLEARLNCDVTGRAAAQRLREIAAARAARRAAASGC